MKKQAAWPDYYNFAEFLRLTSLRDKTAEMVARFTQFASLDDYLNGYSITGDRLATLSSPATIITALDDPIIPGRRTAAPDQVAASEDHADPIWWSLWILRHVIPRDVARATAGGRVHGQGARAGRWPATQSSRDQRLI